MIYLVGGPTRGGKSTVVREVVQRIGLSTLSTDQLTDMFVHADKSGPIKWDMPTSDRAELLWPYLKELMRSRLYYKEPIIISGDAVTPDAITRARKEFGLDVVGCMVGDVTSSYEGKLQQVKKYSNSEGDWLTGKPEAWVEMAVRRCLEQSAKYQKQCEDLGIKFFNTGENFYNAVYEAADYLINVPGIKESTAGFGEEGQRLH